MYADEAGWAGLRMLRAGNGRSFVLYSMPPSRSLRWTVPKCNIDTTVPESPSIPAWRTSCQASFTYRAFRTGRTTSSLGQVSFTSTGTCADSSCLNNVGRAAFPVVAAPRPKP